MGNYNYTAEELLQWNPSLIGTPLGQKKTSGLVRCPDFKGRNVGKQGVWDSLFIKVFLFQGCPEGGVPL